MRQDIAEISNNFKIGQDSNKKILFTQQVLSYIYKHLVDEKK
jgi:hypothetical protein